MVITRMVVTPNSKNPPLSTHEFENIIQAVRYLVLGDRHLNCSTSDKFLTRFIKASEYDVQKSYELIQVYFRSKKENPDEFFIKSSSIYISTISRLDLGYAISKPDYCGRKILLLRFGDIDPRRENWYTLMQSATIVLESLSFEPDIQDTGVNLIFDCTNFSLKIMRWATPYKLRVLMKFLQECIPLRFESLHIVNAPLMFNVFYATIKPFMQEDFIKKLNWHNPPFKTLQKFLDPSLIPKHLGGSLENKEVKNWYQVVLNKEQIFKEYSSMGYV